MKQLKFIFPIIALCLLLGTGRASAQWTVIDPSNIAQSIVNSSKSLVQESTTATNMVNNFKETVKIYQQAKKYYDALQSVNNLVRDARKVQQTVLMLGDISGYYVNNFKKMLTDPNFTSAELSAIASGYTRILEEANGVLGDLKQVVNITTLSMTDKDRMDVVDDCYKEMKRLKNLTAYFTNKNISVSYLRAKKKADTQRVVNLYGDGSEKILVMSMLCAIDFSNLHSILRSLYDEMMPLCSDMAGVAQGIAGLGALFYVAYRIWQALSRAEPVDVFPLLRPFAIGFCIMFFPTVVLGTINSVMSPIVQGTASMLEGQTLDMQKYREEKDRLEYEQMMNDPSTAYLVDDAEFDRQIDELGVTEIGTAAGMYIERGMYKVKKAIQNFFRELLEMLFQAASLTIDTIRTFFLVVLAILGPIAFAISVWDGFQNTLVQWICRYIQTYLWLPVADLFSTILAKIQVLMLQNDISELTNNPNVDLDGSNTAYTIFMIIGIIGYFTIPTVAGWIIQAGGMGSYNRSINNTAMTGGSWAGSIAGGVAGNVAGRAGKLLK